VGWIARVQFPAGARNFYRLPYFSKTIFKMKYELPDDFI
jgi:hypothetical protein